MCQNVFGRTSEIAEQRRHVGGHASGRGVETGQWIAPERTAHDGAQVERLLRFAVDVIGIGIGATCCPANILRRIRQVHVRFLAFQGRQIQTAGQRTLHGAVPERKRTHNEETGNRFGLK